jgi:hypothetical protein
MAHNTHELVSAFRASGLTQKEFCAQRGIATSALQYHITKIRKQSLEDDSESSHSPNGCFIPLHTPGSPSTFRTVVVMHGQIGASEIAQLVQAMVR